MIRRFFSLGTLLLLGLAVPEAHFHDDGSAVGSFRPLANFNVPGATTAEIVSATSDGRLLVYSDATGQKFGLVDISNASAPRAVGTIPAGGQPTSVAALPFGRLAVGCVQPGRLVLLDLASRTIVAEKAIGEGPDSVAVGFIRGQLVAVIAIENEGDLGKGYVEIVRLNLTNFASSPSAIVEFDEGRMSSAGLLAVDDPQPEFVALHDTKVAVTLQENNGIAIIDIRNPAEPELEDLFSAGIADDRPADLTVDARISFTGRYPSDAAGSTPNAGVRIPDAIAWSDDGTVLFTADEGEEDFEGGRGWSAHSAGGAVLFDDGGSLEATAVRFGHYPEGRSDAKGIEAEGAITAEFGRNEFLFVSSERGAFVAVYRIGRHERPRFVQLLSTGQAPEGLLAIPSRHLFVTANEGDEGDGSISIFQGVPGSWDPSPSRPTIVSRSVDEPWGALSGLAASLTRRDVLYAVPDNALPSSIYSIGIGESFAPIRERVPVTRSGEQALYDLEGISIDTSIWQPRKNPGFWLASEGDGSTTRNALIQVNSRGEVLREIVLPSDVEAPSTSDLVSSNGFEGVAVSGNGRYLLVAVQRPFAGDEAVNGMAHTRIARYDLKLGRWEAFFYPLVTAPGTIGLSEIALVGYTRHHEEIYAVIERDNQLAGNATLKRIYTFTLDDLAPVDIATLASASTIPGSTVKKSLLRDILPIFTPYEKVEGLTRTGDGDLWVALDNDGGEYESRLVRLALWDDRDRSDDRDRDRDHDKPGFGQHDEPDFWNDKH